MRLVKYFISIIVISIFLGAISGFLYYILAIKDLPSVSTLKDIQLQVPMRIYTADGHLITHFGEKQRIPIQLNRVPLLLKQAFIAVEDSRFYQHRGIDLQGIVRALLVDILAGTTKQGASTITQQLARNFFLDTNRNLQRKIKEIILAIQIELNFSKEEIFELYLNKIYFGKHAYGVGAAAKVYFNKTVDELNLSEMALIAGLPKAPSKLNPFRALDSATVRRNVVLSCMLRCGYINKDQYQFACNQPVQLHKHCAQQNVDALYLAEMVRLEMVKRFGAESYTKGYQVYTTITKQRQENAQKALQKNLINYDRRHGYRGAVLQLWDENSSPWQHNSIISYLSKQDTYEPFKAAVIISVEEKQAKAILADGQQIILPWSGMQWARPFTDDQKQGVAPTQAVDIVAKGQHVWVLKGEKHWWLAQLPQANSSLVAIDPSDGAIMALVGGLNFKKSAFNRVTQSVRLSGSSIKPFIYAAALEKGFTLATLLNDTPITRWDETSGREWRPKNSSHKYACRPLRLRVGIGRSKNVMVVRALRNIGIAYAANYLTRFGFPREHINQTESLALGSMAVTPLQLVRGYAVFVNGGYLVDPYFISAIKDSHGKTIYQAAAKVVPIDEHLPVIYEPVEKSEVLLQPQDQQDEPVVEKMMEIISEDHANLPSFIEWKQGEPVYQGKPYAPHVISEQIAFLIKDALVSAIWGEVNGNWTATGWRAMHALGRRDIGGKTGTTNDSKDAWYTGFAPGMVATVWVGFDNYQRGLGSSINDPQLGLSFISGSEGGAKTAQPAWNYFMKYNLVNVPEKSPIIPKGISIVPIDMQTGQLVDLIGPNTRFEYFISGTEPTQRLPCEIGTLLSESGEQKELF